MCKNGRSPCPSIAGQRCTRSKGKGPILIKSKCYRHLVEVDVPRSINGFPSVCAYLDRDGNLMGGSGSNRTLNGFDLEFD